MCSVLCIYPCHYVLFTSHCTAESIWCQSHELVCVVEHIYFQSQWIRLVQGLCLCCVQVLPWRSRFWFWVLNPVLHWIWGWHAVTSFVLLCIEILCLPTACPSVQWWLSVCSIFTVQVLHPNQSQYCTRVCVEQFHKASINALCDTAFRMSVHWLRSVQGAIKCGCYKVSFASGSFP